MKKILVVDDEMDLVRLYQLVLQTAGYDVNGATSGEQAVALYSESKPNLVLLDVMMPGMNGMEVCRYIRENEGDERSTIIMYTANDSVENRKASQEAGADELISKEVPIDKVTDKIKSYLQSEEG